MITKREELRRIHNGKYNFRKLAKVEIENIIFDINDDLPRREFLNVINASSEQLAALSDGQRFIFSRRALQQLMQTYDIYPLNKEQDTIHDFKLTLKGI